MADLRIVLQLPNEDQAMDVDDDDMEECEDDSGNDNQGQMSFSTIGSGIMAFNDTSIPSPLDITSPEELLTPLARLRSFAISDNIFNRRMIAHDACNVLEALQDDEADFEAGVQCYIKLSEDLEPSVRVELMEQISKITEYFHERILNSAIVPILLRYLTDVNNQVRKTCHSVLVDIIRQGFIGREKFEGEIMPLLRDLTSQKQAPDEYRTEAIALICQICEAFGPQFAKEHFLPIFLDSCRDDSIFHVRKVCAGNFSAFCDIFEDCVITENLLPRFMDLCKDNVWGVRKSCAESFPDFARQTSEEIRINKLSPIFSSLLSDQSRWVRVAAFESLGPFISTFADSKSASSNLSQSSSVGGFAESPADYEKDGMKVEKDFDTFLYWRDPIPPVTFEEDFDDLTVFQGVQEDEEEIQSQVYVNSTTSTDVDQNLDAAPESPEIATADDGGPTGDTPADENVYSPTKEGVFKSVEFSADKENIPIEFSIKLDDMEEAPSNGDVNTGKDEASEAPNAELPTEESSDFKFEPSTSVTEADKEDAEKMMPVEKSENANEEIGSGDNGHAGEDALCAKKETEVEKEKLQVDENQDESSDSGDSDDDFFDENEPKNWQTPNLQDFAELTDFVELGDSSERYEAIDYRIFSSNISDITYSRCDPFDTHSAPTTPKPSIQQNVIPQQLLDNFLSMTDPSRKQTVDTEIAKHCAYSLPGVAYTLGRNNWHCLKDVYQKLATDVQWKVRRTLASSIHELAKILGEELTATELVPIFNGFLKDLDDVRIGVLCHLADFLKLLNPKVRGVYLYQLTDFLTIDNSRNWRFRYELARQLSSLVDLYDADDIVKYVCPIALRLATDRVVAVQDETGRLIATLLSKLNDTDSSGNHFEMFVTKINTEIAKSTKWKVRSFFSKMCYLILKEILLPFSTFLRHFSGPLVELASDKIVNVRILTAKTLSYAANTFCDEGEGEEICQALQELKNDKDRDVRYFADL